MSRQNQNPLSVSGVQLLGTAWSALVSRWTTELWDLRAKIFTVYEISPVLAAGSELQVCHVHGKLRQKAPVRGERIHMRSSLRRK